VEPGAARAIHPVSQGRAPAAAAATFWCRSRCNKWFRRVDVLVPRRLLARACWLE
jgi:hypothetical protein